MQDLKSDNDVGAQLLQSLLTSAEDGQVTFYGAGRVKVTRLAAKEMPAICWEHVSDNIFTQRVIVCAALRYPDLGIVIPGARHYSPDIKRLLDRLQELGVMPPKKQQVTGDNQGFVDNFGNYWNREQSFIIATHAGQLAGKDKCGSEKELYSEDLY